jgi:glutamate dehydrogenase/leucine dehydrogenase
MNIYHEGAVAGGYNRQRAFDHVAEIGGTIAEILSRAKAEKLPTHVVADKIAEERVARARKDSEKHHGAKKQQTKAG